MRTILTRLLKRAAVVVKQPPNHGTATLSRSSRIGSLHSPSNGHRRLYASSPVALCSSASITVEQQQEHHHSHGLNDVSTNGKTVSLRLRNNGEETTNEALLFHAPWLWVNDPKFVHPTSGQKLRSLGQYPQCEMISFAQIITFVDKEEEGEETVDFPPSPPRCLHSRGGVYQTVSSSSSSSSASASASASAADEPQPQQQNTIRTMLQIVWDSGEESVYDLEWLTRCSIISATTTSKKEQLASKTKVTKEIAIGARDNPNSRSIRRLGYQDVLETDEGRFQALHEIMEHGAVLIENAPYVPDDDESTVANLGKRLSTGQLSHGSLYGDVFHVQSMADAHNIAYTTQALPPHQDLTYYESKPFLQLLHCVHDPDSIQGGESVLVDAMAAASELQTLAPDLFDILCCVPATFLKQREGADMVSFKPHIVTDSVHGQVISVHWSPPFEGPLLHLPSAKTITMEDYVRAYQALESMLHNALPSESSSSLLLPEDLEQQCRDYAGRYTWEYALQHGEILVFNNQRMVHARRSFSIRENSGAQRHLIGCYTDAMDTIGAYRIMLRERGDEINGIRNAGNGYLGI
jgi:alpha-ketoglutarate-dependent taurine dioxygenase